MDLSGDRARTILAMVTAKAWKDSAYRKRLVDDPKGVLKEEGVDIPADVTIKVVEDSPTAKYVSINASDFTSAAFRDRALTFVKRLLPIPEGTEVRLVQSTDKVKYLVVAHPPAGVQPGDMADAELMSLVGGGTTNVSTNVEVAQNEAVATETSEAQTAETTTTVVAEGELMAT